MTHSPSSAQSAEREAFEELMRSRGEDHLYRRDVPGCEKFGEYCRQNVQDQWEVWQARAQATKAVATIREGEIAIAVPNGAFDALMSALERADDKGYMPDAMREEWLAFDWRPLRPDATPPSPAAASAHTIGEDAANVAIGEREMSLRVALDFADNPRPYPSLAAPADTNGELYRALKILASAYRAALTAEKVAGKEPVVTLTKTGRVVDFDVQHGAFALSDGKHLLYAAPQQPAQPVAQTLALTDEQRGAISRAADWCYAMAYEADEKALRALLAAQPESSLAEGGERE